VKVRLAIAIAEHLAAEFEAEVLWIADLDAGEAEIEGVIALRAILQRDVGALGKGLTHILALHGELEPFDRLPLDTEADAMQQPRVIGHSASAGVEVINVLTHLTTRTCLEIPFQCVLARCGDGEQA